MNAWRLSSRLLLRQGRSGALWMLIIGLGVAAAALTAVTLFTDRVGRALEQQAGEVLAADLRISGRARPADALEAQARELGLSTARLLDLDTVVYSDNESSLFEVKGAGDGYPLRGRLQVADAPGAADRPADGLPGTGEAWIEPRGLRALSIELGDPIWVGEQALTVTRLLTYEPDRGDGPFALAPRVIVALPDLLDAGLLGPGSRARHRLLVAGPAEAVSAYEQAVRPTLDDRTRLTTIRDAENQTSEALDQARRFLAVAALTAVVLAAVAVLLAALRFAEAQRDLVAVLKAFGARGAVIQRAMLLMLLGLVLCAAALGALGGGIGQHLIAEILAGNLQEPLPPVSLAPLPGLAAFTLLLAVGFALPPLAALRHVPPMRILNRSLDQRPRAGALGWLLAVAVALLLPVIQLGQPRLALYVLGGSAVLALALALAAWGAVRLTRALAHRVRGTYRFGLAGLGRREAMSIVQTTALGLGLMALLLLMVVRTELIDQWRASLPDDTPDHFMVNIQPDQADALREELAALGVEGLQVRPMANANLVAITGETPPDDAFTGQVNLSWIDRLPPANVVREGRFWSPDATGEISLASRWAERVGVGLGDRLTFDGGGQTFTGEVTSIREVDWGSFNVNFFLLVTPEAANQLPHQYIASFRAPPDRLEALDRVARSRPNVTLLDVGALVDRVFEIIDQVSRAAQVVFAFTLAAGLVVLLAALEATRDQRRSEAALLRTLGAERRMVRGGLLIEYGVMAVIAAALAVAGAAVVGGLLARELFGFDYRPGVGLFALGFGASVALIVGAGWLGNRSVLQTPPVRILRER
ncbi:oxidoreductase [Wenzhouxiangella sp. XN79A]|uniref:ABC transporter permease n=1 Tax=Wenzhouxiangella sp. XN79A TaxID=2724193 RepID=UPI00144A4F18|nr:FtsX-like permease family protein [Wenzhouxiangella sp. XN79A]NKI34214.1 oxidoreductase [Wenzhouxiangella sp. XN79A]